MGVIITGKYLGDKKCELRHEDSGVVIRTDAPKDNQGEGSSFSPTDLFAASLGGCITTILGIVAWRDNVSLEGTHFRVEKEMSASPRRVGSLKVEIHLPKAIPSDYRKKLENAGGTCPVHHSLHPDIVVEVAYHYDV